MPDGFSSAYKPKERYLQPREAQLLLAELTPDRAARVAFIIATGARWGESERAQLADIDLARQIVRLRGTKTKASARFVPIVGASHDLLGHAVRYAEGDGTAMFRPWGNVRRDLAEACERAGIASVTPNDLRRTTATWLRMAEVEPHLIGTMLGHTDSRMVERVYGGRGRLACQRGTTDALCAKTWGRVTIDARSAESGVRAVLVRAPARTSSAPACTP